MCLIYFREINDGLTVDVDGACEQDTLPLPKFKPQRVPGPQLPIRSRVDGSQFTTPIDFFRLFFSYELLVYFKNKKSLLVSFLAHFFISISYFH